MMDVETAPALIIEDDGRLATVFAEALRTAGFVPQIAANGREALGSLQTGAPALLLLDLHLPDIGGDELLRQMRQMDYLSQTVIILTTADAVMAAELRSEVDLVLLKPISFRQLRDLAARLYPK